MKLEDQVCSLELAKKLKELGVKQGSSLYWTQKWMPHQEQDWLLDINKHGNQICAFTELKEMLPQKLALNGPWWSSKTGDQWECRYRYYVQADQEADTEADARAKMLIYLIENNLMRASDGPHLLHILGTREVHGKLEEAENSLNSAS